MPFAAPPAIPTRATPPTPRTKYPMKVVAGLFHSRLGFKALHYIDAEDCEEWLLSMSCDLYASHAFDWDGEVIPNNEVSPTITYSFGLDQTLNRLCGARRGVDWKPGAS